MDPNDPLYPVLDFILNQASSAQLEVIAEALDVIAAANHPMRTTADVQTAETRACGGHSAVASVLCNPKRTAAMMPTLRART